MAWYGEGERGLLHVEVKEIALAFVRVSKIKKGE